MTPRLLVVQKVLAEPWRLRAMAAMHETSVEDVERRLLLELRGGAKPRPPKLSARIRFQVMRRDHYRCQLCGATANDGVILEVDHKIARANGGSDDLTNLWVLCKPCNGGKGIYDL